MFLLNCPHRAPRPKHRRLDQFQLDQREAEDAGELSTDFENGWSGCPVDPPLPNPSGTLWVPLRKSADSYSAPTAPRNRKTVGSTASGSTSAMRKTPMVYAPAAGSVNGVASVLQNKKLHITQADV